MAYSLILLPSFNEKEYATLPARKEEYARDPFQENKLAGVEGVAAKGDEGVKAEGENLPEE